MNELTNPSGCVQGAMPYSSVSLKRNASLTPQTAGAVSHITKLPSESHEEKWSMLGGTRYKFDRYTREQRIAGANILNAHLLMVEIMMSSITNQYVHSVIRMLKERNMMRHNLKRRANGLLDVSTDLMKRCNLHDKEQVRTFTQTIFPSLTEQYYSDGGSLILRLQNTFLDNFSNQLTLIKVATKNALDKARIKQSDLVAEIQMVAMMCYTGIEFYNTICKKVDGMLAGVANTERKKSMHNEKMLNAAKELLREMVGNIELPKEEGENARKLTFQFQRELVKEDLLQLVERGIQAMQMDFIEYALAAIRLKLEENTFNIADYRMLLLRMGKKQNVKGLFSELRSVALPEDGSRDLLDIAETMPEAKPKTTIEEDSFIDNFRHLCIEDKIAIPLETTEEAELRHLRQEVYRNNGILPIHILRYMYHYMGTKKAMNDYLKKGGIEVMGRTLRYLKSLKTDSLKLAKGRQYGLFIGLAIKQMYELRGFTRQSFAQKIEVPFDYMGQLETLGDISRNASIIAPSLKMVIDVAKILKMDARHILFAALKETDKEGGLPDAYVCMMNSIENSKKKVIKE